MHSDADYLVEGEDNSPASSLYLVSCVSTQPFFPMITTVFHGGEAGVERCFDAPMISSLCDH